MKIIKKATKTPWWVGIDGVCVECGYVIQLDTEDTKSVNTTFYKIDKSISYVCPHCSNNIWFIKDEDEA